MKMRYLWTILLLIGLASGVVGKQEVKVMAPGWGELQYPIPEAGSYRLPPLSEAKDGKILLSDGETVRLKDVYGKGKITVLSFIYTQCSDANGCPLATFVLHAVRKRLNKQPEVAQGLRLVSLSFDPRHDTPEKMQEYGKNFERSNVEWLFATTESEEKLQPILDDYGQYVVRDETEDGISSISHLLRVYLIDEQQRIRNIYSTDFLHPDLLIADVKTLQLESAAKG